MSEWLREWVGVRDWTLCVQYEYFRGPCFVDVGHRAVKRVPCSQAFDADSTTTALICGRKWTFQAYLPHSGPRVRVCVCVSKTSRAGSSVNQGQRIKIIMIIIKRSQIFTGFSARVARLVLLLVKKHQTVRAVHHLHSYIAMQSISDRETQRFYLILCFSAVGANSINFRVTNSAQKWGRERELEKQDGGWG